MDQASRPRRPAGLLGMLALILAFEGFVAGHQRAFRNPWGWDWFLAGSAAGAKVGDCQVLCFGDSLIKFGLSPQVIRRGTGLEAYNLAIVAAEMPANYVLLRKALDSGARPRAVVLGAAPYLLDKKVAGGLLWPEIAEYRDCLELARATELPGLLGSMATAKLLPSVKDRLQIRKAIVDALAGASPSPGYQVLPSLIRNAEANRGAMMSGHPATRPEAGLPALAAELFPPRWRVDELATRYADKFIALAEGRGIRVYWLIAPLLPEVQNFRDFLGLDAKYVDFVRGLQARHPGLIVLDAGHSGYGPDVHSDPVHLDVRGALCLSRDVAAVLALGGRGGDRWVKLPAYRDLPAEVELEDLNRSAGVVAAKVRR